jgi:hypothetical protein
LPRGGGVRLFDWDGWRVGLASSDLAYMMATHWYPERRRRLERPLLDRYHAALLARGVRAERRSGRGLPVVCVMADYDAQLAGNL